MVKRFLLPLLAALIIAAMVVPGCGDTTDPDAPTYALTMAVNPTGAGSAVDVTDDSPYEEGASVTIQAFAATGYNFVNWTAPAGGFADDEAATTTFTMPGADVEVTANFDKETAPYFDFIADEYTDRGLGDFGAEAAARFENLRNWYTAQGHFWVGSGAFYLDGAFPATSQIVLKRFADYPDDLGAKWFEELMDITTAPAHQGAWVDVVTISQILTPSQAYLLLEGDELDVYAHAHSDPDLFDDVDSSLNVDHKGSVGLYNEFTFNPVLVFDEGEATETFNPFGDREMREIVNYLIDRDFIVGTIMQNMAVAKFTSLSGPLPDAAIRYPAKIAAIEAAYAFNQAQAITDMATRMGALGCVLASGTETTDTWHKDGKEIVINILARSEDERQLQGQYLQGQLQLAGFKTTIEIGTSSAIGRWTTPLADWNVYTGGWITTVVSRDQGGNFAFFYTDMGGWGLPLWMAYDNDPLFYDVADKVSRRDFSDMAERETMFGEALDLAMEDSARVWVTDNLGWGMHRAEVEVAADLAGGIHGSWQWGNTVHFQDGGGTPMIPTGTTTLRSAMMQILVDPWNPIAGSNWIYDMHPIRATGDLGVNWDTTTGLFWPQRIEKATVVVQEDLPVAVTNAWCTRETSATPIAVPNSAWADWDAETQTPITAAERAAADSTYVQTALRKSVVYYPEGTFGLEMHDGNELSFADFLYYYILTFDRAKDASAIYDSSEVPSFTSFMKSFKGVEFDTDVVGYDLVVTTYSDVWYLDAEWAVTDWFPNYAQGPGMWHVLALGIWAEEANQIAFSEDKSDELDIEWMSLISGPSIPILEDWLTFAE